jgi:hypothetical protein
VVIGPLVLVVVDTEPEVDVVVDTEPAARGDALRPPQAAASRTSVAPTTTS